MWRQTWKSEPCHLIEVRSTAVQDEQCNHLHPLAGSPLLSIRLLARSCNCRNDHDVSTLISRLSWSSGPRADGAPIVDFSRHLKSQDASKNADDGPDIALDPLTTKVAIAMSEPVMDGSQPVRCENQRQLIASRSRAPLTADM